MLDGFAIAPRRWVEKKSRPRWPFTDMSKVGLASASSQSRTITAAVHRSRPNEELSGISIFNPQSDSHRHREFCKREVGALF